MSLPSLIDGHDLDVLCGLAEASPPGCFVEVGVYQGGSAERLYQVAEKQGRTLHLFDTFDGHPIVTQYDDAVNHYQGRYRDAIDPRELQRRLPNAVIHQGIFPDTLPAYLCNVAFVHSDVDLYAPTLAVCQHLGWRVVDGGCLYFDDYGRTECPGVAQAIHEVYGNDGSVLPNGKYAIYVGV